MEKAQQKSPLTQNAPITIGISGSYGGLNHGDEAILCSILLQLHRDFGERLQTVVFSRNPEYTLKHQPTKEAIAARKMARQELKNVMQGLDLLIIGGGGIFFDGEVEFFIREMTIAQELGVPIFVYGVSAGPLQKPENKTMLRDVLNQVDVLTVRDQQGKQVLEEIGVSKQIHLLADPAILLTPETVTDDQLHKEGIDFKRKLVGFSVREPGPAAPDIKVEHYHRLIANVADFAVERYDAEVVFMPLEHKNMDIQHCHSVVALMQAAKHAIVLRQDYSPRQLIDIVGRFEFAVGMRLHFLIFAAIQRVPFVPLPYAPKISGFIEQLGMQMPLIGQIDSGRLIAQIDRTWDLRQQVKAQIETHVPAMQEKAEQVHQLLAQRIARLMQQKSQSSKVA